jgi:hypothetical protein
MLATQVIDLERTSPFAVAHDPLRRVVTVSHGDPAGCYRGKMLQSEREETASKRTVAHQASTSEVGLFRLSQDSDTGCSTGGIVIEDVDHTTQLLAGRR